MVPEQIEREIVIAAPVERVWEVITQPEHVGSWFGDAGAEIDLRPGGAMVFRWSQYGAFRGVVETVEPPRLFAYRWARPADAEPRAGNSTRVEFTLTPEGGGTRLRVVESGFRALDISADEQETYAAGNVQGWLKELDELREYLEKVAA